MKFDPAPGSDSTLIGPPSQQAAPKRAPLAYQLAQVKFPPATPVDAPLPGAARNPENAAIGMGIRNFGLAGRINGHALPVARCSGLP